VTQAEEIVEAAGRVCYMSFGKAQSPRTNAEYIQNLIQMGHESVLEHVNWTFLLTGISRACTHQLVRHRVGFSFSQLSQQYHDEIDAEFIEPSALNLSPDAQIVWKKAVKTAKAAYCKIMQSLKQLEDKVGKDLNKMELRRAIRSIARSILPNATETKIVMTANARALRYFLKTRGSIPGDEEMRRMASELLKQLQKDAPSIFSDFRINMLSDGSPIVTWHKLVEMTK